MADKTDYSATEDFFGLPRGSLVETKAATYRYEPKTPLPSGEGTIFEADISRMKGKS